MAAEVLVKILSGPEHSWLETFRLIEDSVWLTVDLIAV